MTITASSLIARVSVAGAQAAQGQLLGVGAASDAAEARLRSLATIGAGVVAAGLIAAGVASAKMAADFQQAVNRLRTGAGDTQDSFATLSKGILQVSVATGVLSGPLTKAMYEILSSGQRGAQAFSTLAAAAKGAVIEQANVVDVSDTLAGAMTNFGTKVFGANAYMNGLITAVARGRITLQDLSTAIGPIEPVAHAMGISFADLSAAMSTQTNAAIPAARAATGLRFMMQALEVPTTKAKDAMAAMGLKSVDVANEMRVSLPGALQMIYDAAKKAGPEGSVPFNRAVSDMVGGQRSLGAFLALTGTHMQAFSANAKAISGAMKSGSGEVNGWALAQTNFNVILDKGKAVLQAVAISIGAQLLPALGRLVGGFVTVVQYVANFSQHANVLVPILAALGVVIGAILVSAAIALVTALSPLILIVGAIAATVAGLTAIFMHFYSTNAGFKTFIDGFVAGFKQAAGFLVANFIPAVKEVGSWLQANVLPVLKTIGGFLVATFAPVWKQLADVWNGSILPSLKQLWAALVPLAPVFKLVGEIIGGIVLVSLGLLVGLLKGAVQALAGFLGGLATFIGGIVQFITGLVQVVSGVVTFIYDLVTGHFSKLAGDLARIWDGIKNMFGGAWKAIEGIFQAAWGVISGFVSGLVSGIVGFFQGLFNTLVGHSLVPDLINAIIGFFASLPGKALSAIGSLAGRLAGFFGGLASQAFGWGANIISNLASGIIGNIGSAIGGAMSALGGFIHDHLPSSPAKVGPLKDLALQGSKISEQIAAGMLSGLPQLQSSLSRLLTPVSVGVTASVVPASFRAGGAQPTIIVQPPPVYLDGVRLSRGLMPHLVRAIRYSTGVRGI